MTTGDMLRNLNTNPNDGWNEWGKHVLLELEALGQQLEDLNKKIEDVRIQLDNKISNVKDTIKTDITDFKVTSTRDITELKVKSGIWGLTGGVLGVVVAILVKMLGG